MKLPSRKKTIPTFTIIVFALASLACGAVATQVASIETRVAGTVRAQNEAFEAAESAPILPTALLPEPEVIITEPVAVPLNDEAVATVVTDSNNNPEPITIAATVVDAEIESEVVSDAPPTESPLPTAQPLQADPLQGSVFVDLYNRLNPSVVSIYVFAATQGEGQGTGWLYDAEGRIVTNNHVVAGADYIEVTFSDGTKQPARFLGADETADLAVIQVDTYPAGTQPLPLANSDQIQVGQRVVAIGNPFGLAGTMTTGIVSGLGRTLSGRVSPEGGRFSAPDIIQTDAAINPGNSGGPLINLNGEVLGVNKAIVSETGVNSGVGFTISANTVRRIVPSLIANGQFTYSYLGISSQSSSDLTLPEMDALGLPNRSGVYVVNVVPNSPSAAAGIIAGSEPSGIQGLGRGGDFIIAIDGNPVKDFSELISYLVNNADVGQTVTLRVLRGGTEIDIPVTLGARP